METKKDLKLFIGPRNSGKTTSCVVESYFTGAPILTMFNKFLLMDKVRELGFSKSLKAINLNDFELSKLCQTGDNIIVDDAIQLLNFLLRRHYGFKGTISAASITTNDV